MKTALLSAAIAWGASAVFANPIQERADSTSSSSLPAVSVKGNAFFAGGKRFYIRGVDYQPGGSSDVADPIADKASCTRDIVEFKKLGINTVRVYTVDNSVDHDDCMNALAAAGIYLALDVNTPKYSLNRASPHESYNDVYLQSLFATIDAFAGYTNTLLFFSGNEVVNDGPTSNTAPYVKAVTRDMRQYIRSRKYRSIPVGYSAADVDTNRLQMAQYMNCGTDDERSDFFAFNDYSWCDPSSFTVSGWDQKVKNFTGYGIPLFLSEYGCNTNTRKFEEVSSLYSTDMTSVYSGGLVYEYSQEASNYGLVEVDGDSVTELADFTALKTALEDTPVPDGDGGYNSTGGANSCPSLDAPNWDVANDSLPAIPDGAKKYMSQGAGTGPGLEGKGSQNAGGVSTGTATAGSGAATVTGSSSSSSDTSSSSTHSASAAGPLVLPTLGLATVVSGLVVVFSTLFGAALL